MNIRQYFALLLALALFLSQPGLASEYSVVINNGRVIDPETGLDDIRHLGLRGDMIAVISEQPLAGADEIDASGLVVAPGFIDLHTHSPTPLGQYYQAFDGVTTALELEAGHHPVREYGGQVSPSPMINYGASAGYVGMRLYEKNGLRMSSTMSTPQPEGWKGWWTALMFFLADFDTALGAALTEPADAEELARLEAMLVADLGDGALGIGLALDYFSAGIQANEMEMIFATAAAYEVPVFVHIRRGIDGDTAGLLEVVELARRHGNAVHVCHITHNAISNLDGFLAIIAGAQREGIDITTEVLPYNAGSALISSAVFSRDWQTIFNISYEDVEWASTGERFDQAMWEDYHANRPDGQVIHHYLREEWTRQAVATPGVIVVSDLLAMESLDKKVAPHNGAFSKVLGRYVREEGLLDLPTAIGKVTLLPARRLEHFAPDFRRRGRVQEGAYADLTIFDPDTVRDNATYQSPYREATGIEHVIVNGEPVIRAGARVEGTYPGRRLVGEAQRVE